MPAAVASETRTGLVRRARKIDRALGEAYPDAKCELDFDDPFQLLVVTVLSAQTTDKRVNLVRPTLFAAYPDPRAMAAADRAHLEQIVGPLGFFRAKTESLLKLSAALVERYDGEVPPRRDRFGLTTAIGHCSYRSKSWAPEFCRLAVAHPEEAPDPVLQAGRFLGPVFFIAGCRRGRRLLDTKRHR